MIRRLIAMAVAAGVGAVLMRQLRKQAEKHQQPLPAPKNPIPITSTSNGIPPSHALTTHFSGRVERWIGADRLEIRRDHDGKLIYLRLWAIAAPQGNQPYAREALTFARQFVGDQAVRVELHDSEPADDRILGWLLVGSKSLNLALVEQGLAWWYRDMAADAREIEMAELRARLSSTGLWQDGDPVEPWNWTES